MTQPTSPSSFSTTPNPPATDGDWRLLMRRHWKAFSAFFAAAAALVAWAVYIFVWFTGNIQTAGLVPQTLGLWSMGDIVTFILHGVFWMLILVGIPAAVGAAAGYGWWKHLPSEERSRYDLDRKSHKKSGAGGAISPLLFIAFAIKVYLDGNWTQAIASWNLDYVVGSMVTIFIWLAVIFAVPAAIALTLWVSRVKANLP